MDCGDVKTGREAIRDDVEYEPPAVVDFGPVFDVTRGSGKGNQDGNGQGFD